MKTIDVVTKGRVLAPVAIDPAASPRVASCAPENTCSRKCKRCPITAEPSRRSLQGLPTGIDLTGVPQNEQDIALVMHSPKVGTIRHFVLGPAGTNISQAAAKWNRRMRLGHKSESIFCDTPEGAVEAAKNATQGRDIGVFWTCAVYVKENEILFNNLDACALLLQQTMFLDDMQIAVSKKIAWQVQESGQLKPTWHIASHPSPTPLLRALLNPVVFARSNAEAAWLCAQGHVEACVTTEKSRATYGLAAIHHFGQILMHFYGGIPKQGIELLREASGESASDLSAAA